MKVGNVRETDEKHQTGRDPTAMNVASLIADRTIRAGETVHWYQHFQQTQDALRTIAETLAK